MKSIPAAWLVTLGLCACASQPEPAIGQFAMAGPRGESAPQLSMRWEYGIRFSVDPASVSEIRFDCGPIPGSTFIAKAGDLKVLANGVAYAHGPALAISDRSTPWLFEPSTTSARCRAVVSRFGEAHTAVITAPVSFSPAQKASTLAMFQMAHEYNNSLKK